MEGNQENQITVQYTGENFRLPTSKIRANTGHILSPGNQTLLQCYIKMRADGEELGWMLEVAGEHVVLCYHTKTEQPSRLERMKTLTSASVVERLPATTENISVPSRDTKTQGDTTLVGSGTQHTAKEIKILNLIGGCLSKRDGSGGTCTGQQDKQICWKYSSRRRVLSGHLLPPSLPPSWR